MCLSRPTSTFSNPSLTLVRLDAHRAIAAVRAIVIDRGTTYVYLGTPARRRLEEVVHGAFLGRLIAALPGVDIRIAADRARRRELLP